MLYIIVFKKISQARTISRSRINGSEQSIVIQGDLGTIDGLAIDSVAGNLYWTDPAADTITTSRLDGSSRKVNIIFDITIKNSCK